MVGLISSVTVPAPEDASNKAASELPGTDAPEAPPEVVAQLVVLFQLPVPPVTQNLFAIITLFYSNHLDGHVCLGSRQASALVDFGLSWCVNIVSLNRSSSAAINKYCRTSGGKVFNYITPNTGLS